VLWVNAVNGQGELPRPHVGVADWAVHGCEGAVHRHATRRGDYDIFVDRDATGWLAETVRGSIVIQKLSSDYTDGVGASVTAVPATVPTPPDLWCVGQTFCGQREGPSLFRHGNFYYLVVSDPACPYCQGGTSYYMATRPTGPWKGPGSLSGSTPTGAPGVDQGELISPDSCGGQARSVSNVPTATGSVRVYGSDLWRGITRQVSPGGPVPSHASDGNQALATKFWAPLRFRREGTIQRIDCTAVAEVPLAEGHVASSAPTAYQTACVIGEGQGVRQELRPLVLPISAEANASLTVTLRSSTRRGCYGVLLAHSSEPGAGTYEGPVAGTPTSTRAVGILATPAAVHASPTSG
jgi:hypothetical protein